MMEFINISSKILRDDLSVEITQGSNLSIAAACSSLYDFVEPKMWLKGSEERRFIFTSPAFTAERAEKEK